MKASDDSLRRLLDAAAKAPAEVIGAPPLGLETRVLANWRAAKQDDAPAFLFVFLRRAMIAACFVFIGDLLPYFIFALFPHF